MLPALFRERRRNHKRMGRQPSPAVQSGGSRRHEIRDKIGAGKMVWWVLIIVSVTGGVHYEEVGRNGGWNEDKCEAIAAAINDQTERRLHAYCVGARHAE